MMINDVTAQAGRHKGRKRVGRGEGSGWGKTSTRGHKGQQSRSGGGTRPLQEGGQMPMFRRLPKRGFSNVQFERPYTTVNINRLESRFNDGDTVDVDALRKAGLVSGDRPRVKILAKGNLTKKLTVAAQAFSAGAKDAIEKAGGTAQLMAEPSPAEKARAKRGKGENRKPDKAKPAPAEKKPAETPAAPPADAAPAAPEAAAPEPTEPPAASDTPAEGDSNDAEKNE
jgi:large subunit ribosomal protein L15